MHPISQKKKSYEGGEQDVIENAILYAAEDWFYPVINGIPRLLVEASIDYAGFFEQHMPDFPARKEQLLRKYGPFIRSVAAKNKRTKQSFELEWSLFNYKNDKTWNLPPPGMLQQFLDETGETETSLRDKLVFDAGCGNGKLNPLVAALGCTILGMDLGRSIERAWEQNTHPKALFIQGDVQFPPVAFEHFDIVHCSGVLIHTNHSELSFSCIAPCVRPGGKLSVWVYHPRKNMIHNLFNGLRRLTSPLPVKLQYYIYLLTLFPISFIVKRLKGNKQNAREMIIDILDWFSPEFRREHTTGEVSAWFYKRQFPQPTVTTSGLFGFNMTGIKTGE